MWWPWIDSHCRPRDVGGRKSLFLVVGLVVFVVLTYSRFQADVQLNRERLLSESDIVTTEEFGDVEYAVQGEGLPVLLAQAC